MTIAKGFRLLFLLLLAHWFYLFLTVDSNRFYLPTIRPSFEQYWQSSGLAVKPTKDNPTGVMPIEEAQRDYPESYAKHLRNYQRWLGRIAAEEQKRLAVIHDGSVPKWPRSAIIAQWHFLQWGRQWGEHGPLPVVGVLIMVIVGFRYFKRAEFFSQRINGLYALRRPIGWYRLAVLSLACIGGHYLYYLSKIPFLELLYFFYDGMALAYGGWFAWLLNNYFLRDL